MAFMDFLFGSKAKNKQLPTMSPDQIQAMQSMLSQGMQGMQNPYQGFEPIEQQARSQFQQGIPSLAERFTSLSPSAQRSSGFQSALGRAGAGLEESLAAMKANYGLQNRGQSMQMANMGLRPQFENMYSPETGGFMQNMAGTLGRTGLGMATGGMLGSGMFGRNMMNSFNKNDSLTSLIPLLMMMQGGQR